MSIVALKKSLIDRMAKNRDTIFYDKILEVSNIREDGFVEISVEDFSKIEASTRPESNNLEKQIIFPGSHLKLLLSKLGIKADSGCKCSDRARHMDYMEQTEPGWCERNIDTIVGWLEEEAKKRKLPFIKTVAKMLVKRAIKNAQRN